LIPTLFGRTAEERVVIDMWERRFELDGFIPIPHVVRNHVPNFVDKVIPGTRNDLPQLAKMVSCGKEMTEISLAQVEPHMAKNDCVAGSEFTVADITAFFTVRMTNAFEMDLVSSYPAVAAWLAKVSARAAFKL